MTGLFDKNLPAEVSGVWILIEKNPQKTYLLHSENA